VFEWDDFLELADRLAAGPADEAAARTAISRAYYAAFHAGREFLASSGIDADMSRRAHQQVRQVLQARDAGLGDVLGQLHDWRKQADYDDRCAFNVYRQANLAIIVARMTIERIRSLS
jgi:uncharacterized protein (UPF0332 family)